MAMKCDQAIYCTTEIMATVLAAETA